MTHTTTTDDAFEIRHVSLDEMAALLDPEVAGSSDERTELVGHLIRTEEIREEDERLRDMLAEEDEILARWAEEREALAAESAR
jgi:hypothetical protein